MPRYFFHALNGDLFQPDTKGKTLPGDDAAFEYALGLDGTDEPQATIRTNSNETWPANTSRLSSLAAGNTVIAC